MSVILFLGFIFFKQFYLFPSGSLGIGDLLLASSCVCVCVEKYKTKSKFNFSKWDCWGLVFLLAVLVINSVYGFFYKQPVFFKYTLFWLYNGLAVICFRELINERFLRLLTWMLKVNILLQCVIYVMGWGRDFVEYWGGVRYMGTFNDPNQFAFYMFAAMLLIYLYSCCFKDYSFPLFYFLAVWMVVVSKSTGVFVGFVVFTFGIGILSIYKLYVSKRIAKIWWWIAGVLFAGGSIMLCYLLLPSGDFTIQNSDFSIISRIQEKLLKLSETGIIGFLYDRGAEKLVLYPQYLLYGAGEGYYERFTRTSFVNEIHSSLISIWFCYGIVPTVCLLVWLKPFLIRMDKWMLVAVIALLAESMLLVNYRQPFFWMILMYGIPILQYKHEAQRGDSCCDETNNLNHNIYA